MNLNPRSVEYLTQTEILYTSEGAIAKVGGVTLQGSLFTAGAIVKAGTAVSIQTGTGLAKPYADADTGRVYLISHDVVIDSAQNNTVVGAWEKALVMDAKLTGVTAAFKTAAGARYDYMQ